MVSIDGSLSQSPEKKPEIHDLCRVLRSMLRLDCDSDAGWLRGYLLPLSSHEGFYCRWLFSRKQYKIVCYHRLFLKPWNEVKECHYRCKPAISPVFSFPEIETDWIDASVAFRAAAMISNLVLCPPKYRITSVPTVPVAPVTSIFITSVRSSGPIMRPDLIFL